MSSGLNIYSKWYYKHVPELLHGHFAFFVHVFSFYLKKKIVTQINEGKKEENSSFEISEKSGILFFVICLCERLLNVATF